MRSRSLPPLPRILRRARVLLAVYFANVMQYRAEIFMWALSNLMPFIMMGLWVTASDGGDYALTSVEFAQYFVAMFLVRQFTIVWVIWEFEWHVVEGRLSPFLLQPMDPVWRFVATHIAERGARMPFTAGLLVLFFVLYPEAWWVPGLDDAALALAATVMAFALRFLMQYSLAMACFWVERAAAMENMTWVFYLFLSGMIAPLEIFPEPVRQIALWTPFPYLIYFPSRMLVDSSAVNLTQGFGVLALWIVAFFVLNRVLWRLGLKHYSAMGA
jgi:ABC-2 type transport system permease protein